MESPVVAVLGGGQLGRMLGLAAIPLGVHCRFLDPVAGAPAAAVGPLVVGPLGDPAALDEVTAGARVVTYEWEGVPADAARRLSERVAVRPGWRALSVAQDRLEEKTAFRRLGIGVPEFAAVDGRADLDAALARIGTPAILKTRRGGYDGKGQQVLRALADADAAFAALAGAPLVLEAMVPFDRELSVIAARGPDGDVRCFPVVENLHRDGILRVSRVPGPDTADARQADAEAIAQRLLDDLDYEGVLTVELFDVGGVLLANEIAPRVHNSGHWTIEGAETSQFEQHLRAVLDYPLGSTAMTAPVVVMANVLGGAAAADDWAGAPLDERVHHFMAHWPDVKLHWYGKGQRPGRKLGHVTALGTDVAEVRARAVAAARYLADGVVDEANAASSEH